MAASRTTLKSEFICRIFAFTDRDRGLIICRQYVLCKAVEQSHVTDPRRVLHCAMSHDFFLHLPAFKNSRMRHRHRRVEVGLQD